MTAAAAQLQPDAFHEAIVLQWTWKTPAMQRMAVAVCTLALEKCAAEFSANDLPEFDHGGDGIAGSVFRILADHLVLSRVGSFEGGVFFPKTVSNPGGNPVRLWRLANAGLARALLKVHGVPVPEWKQPDLPVTVS